MLRTALAAGERSGNAGTRGRRVAGLVRQPLLHFVAIGAGVFALFAWLDDTPSPVAGERIVVSEARVVQLADHFEATWRRPPTPEEREGLIDAFIREEIYVREARALGLDRDDTVIRRRLQQKMALLTASAAAALDPTEAELRAHYDANAERFTTTPRLAFAQVFLGQNPSRADVAAARATLARGADPSTVGERTLLPATLPLSPPNVVDGTFGRGVFDRLADLESERWTGPITSAFGSHLVKVVEREPASVRPFEAVRAEVEADWREVRAQAMRERQFERLRARYTVVRAPESAP